MRLCYVLLSPTPGMHQYTADLANRMAVSRDVHLVTTTRAPRGQYGPGVTVHTPATINDTGLSMGSARVGALRRVDESLGRLEPDIIHFTGPHLWNLPLLARLRRRDAPVIHTIHDLDPHAGMGYGRLLHVWNAFILRLADRILVHGERYRNRLLARGMPPHRVSFTPLLFLLFGYEEEGALQHLMAPAVSPATGENQAVEERIVLFFGRLMAYKGLETLLTAWTRLAGKLPQGRLIVAGCGKMPRQWRERLPAGVELHNRRIEGMEAVALFRACDLVVLPYLDASQSALVANAYFFGKPALATRSGALPEYVQDGRTGFLVAPGDAEALARTLGGALARPERLRRMGQAGRAWYERERRREQGVLEDLYRDVLRY